MLAVASSNSPLTKFLRKNPLRRHLSRKILKDPFLWAVAVRVFLLFAVPRGMQGDSVDFHQIATNIAQGHGFSRCFGEPFPPTSQRPPLYPYVLGMLYSLGAGPRFGAAILNLVLDLASMGLARAWGRRLGFAWAEKIPWVIALCPLLVTYGMYPTTENISIFLYFLALYFLSARKPVASGLSFGLLSLCRSYFLLFPILIWLFRPLRDWSRKSLALVVLASFAAPGVWVARNAVVLNRISFSQGAGVGWQSYQGVCVANFDWWKPEHISLIASDPLFLRMTQTHCSTEEQIAELDKQALEKVRLCVTEKPLEAARNVLAKGLMLFVNWGLFMPYNLVPFVVQHLVNAALFLYWIGAIAVLRGRRRNQPRLEDAIRLATLNIGYIAAVTLPFAVDARYLLAPFLVLLVCVFEASKKKFPNFF